MSKITSEHLARAAFIYVRQSTAYQVVNNLERQRRQYGLVERARQLGWDNVELVDEDLGRSGGGTVRPGFEKLLAAICEGRVGAVVSLEASRLARNGRDWHTLLEFCGLVGTLIVDEEAIYDPRSPNDRLLLGMKGTMSEMEVSVFRQRSIEAMRQKARRGELHLTGAVGYVKTDDNRIEKDLDRRVRDAIVLVFHKFAGKKIKGKKRHILVDTTGLLMHAIVHPADIQDRDGGGMVMATLFGLYPFLLKVYADGGYQGPVFQSAVKAAIANLNVEIVKRSDQAKGFMVLPKRWVVERTFAWLNRCRRLARDWECLNRKASAYVLLASIRLMVRRLGRITG